MIICVASGAASLSYAEKLCAALRGFHCVVHESFALDSCQYESLAHWEEELAIAERLSLVQRSTGLIALLPAALEVQIEIGAALGLRKPIVLLGHHLRACAYYRHPSVVLRSRGHNVATTAKEAIVRIRDANFMLSSIKR